MSYNPQNWYWVVAGSTTQVYSSARTEYVSVSDATYEAWLAAGNQPTKIDTDANLQAVIYQSGVLGLSVTSTSTPALNGVFAVSDISQSDINAVATYIEINGTFPQGQSVTYWAQKNGTVIEFPNVAVFKAFATAVADYVDAFEDYLNSGGTIGSLPSPNVTII